MRLFRNRLIWPVLILVLLLLVDLMIQPGFFGIRVEDGHLFGSLVDIVRDGSPTILVSLGMTMVIATRGIDLSVGAIVAISGAVACTIIAGSPAQGGAAVTVIAIVVAVLASLVLGVWNGFLVSVVGIQPIVATLILMVAGRGARLLITGGKIITVDTRPTGTGGNGYCSLGGLQPPSWRSSSWSPRTPHAQDRAGLFIEAVGGNPPPAARRCQRDGRSLVGVRLQRLCAGVAGLISAPHPAADANTAGLWIRARRDPGRGHRRHRLLGRSLLADRERPGRADHPDADDHHLRAGRDTAVHTGAEGGRRGHRLSCPVALVPRKSAARPRPLAASTGGGRIVTLTKTAVIRTAPRVPGPRRPVSSVAVTTILLCVMFAAGSLRYPGFFSGQVVLDIIVDNSFLVVLAVGMTFVVLTGGLDLSVGSVVGLTRGAPRRHCCAPAGLPAW